MATKRKSTEECDPIGRPNRFAVGTDLCEQQRRSETRRGHAHDQAHTLDAIFNNLARIAIRAEHMDHLDRSLKLALRAQSQCRSTWEALVTIKNPLAMGYVR